MEAHTFVRNAWYVLGLSEEFAGGRLHGQAIAGKPLVTWRSASGRVVAFDELPGAITALADRETIGRTVVLVE